MSYEIYKSIKQLDDGTFQVVCASNNVFPKHWCDYHMTYFKDNWPNANNEEQRALWELYSIGSGDHFYPANWKYNQTLAAKFMQEKGYDWWIHSKDPTKWLEYAKEFIEYKSTQTKKIKKQFVVSMLFCGSRNYVKKKSSRHVWPIYDKNLAKRFSGESIEEIEKMFIGYEKYKPIVEEV